MNKTKIASEMLKKLEKIDSRKESKKITQREHDRLSKKAVIMGLNKIKKDK